MMWDETKSEQNVVWWEKTVEYKFISECIKYNIIQDISPLSGNEERIGDAILSLESAFNDNDRLYIVEFKKKLTSQCFSQEYDKYPMKRIGYNKTKECFSLSEMKAYKKSHYLIAATYDNSDFNLVVRDYFEFESGGNKNLKDAFHQESGLTIEEFKAYILSFSTHKKKLVCHYCEINNQGGWRNTNPDDDTNPDTPSGGGYHQVNDGPVNHTSVISINHINKECKIIPLEWLKFTGLDDDSSSPTQPNIISPKNQVTFSISHNITIQPKFLEEQSKNQKKANERYDLAD